MTHSTQLTQAVDAVPKARATANPVPEPASMKFLVFEDNGGGYHWTIVAARGKRLVQSTSYASYEEATEAAHAVHAGAASASIEPLSGNTPSVDLRARREQPGAREDLDGERSLDEGGSFSSEAATQ